MAAGATDPGTEVVDLVDAEDRVVGRAPRRVVRRDKLLHRGVGVLCRNSAGEIYVHRRTDTKDVFPGMYDMLAGGVVSAGETYEATARREIAEELGIVGPEPRLLFKHRYTGADNPSWIAIFEVVWDGPIRHQAEEIAWGAFLTPDELLRKLDEWPFVPDSLEGFRLYRAGKLP
ncbi:MAG TPA: NUDIX domain-containing protein [Actinomycetota bacterium]|nr:NUDIX domain-containing protein [Actinomycetota bacterium]